MAGRSFLPLLGALDPNVVVLAISWAPDTANPPTAIRGRGVEKVERTAQGVFTVTLQDVYPKLLAATATLQLNAADDKFAANIGPNNLENATRTIVVRTYDISTGGPEDIAANANNRVNLLLVLSNSGL